MTLINDIFMGIDTASPKIKMLLREIENKFGREIKIPADFIELADSIKSEIKQNISPSSLERVWSYSKNDSTLISEDILNSLYEYVGKKNWPEFYIVYFHGLSSSGNSGTGKKLREIFPFVNVITPDIPVNPKEALPFLKGLVASLDPEKTIIVGTSMGGMYAQQMTGYKRILVNPAFHVSNTLKKSINESLPFFSPRKDGATEFKVTEELIKEFKAMEAKQFENACDSENVTALFGNNDTTVNCKEEYLNHYSHFDEFDGEHRLTEENINEIISPLIKEKLGL